MRITRYTDYGLRVLIHLATHPDERVTIADIAESYGISKAHLMQVTRDLASAGWVESSRGRSGGIRLGCPPEDIGLGEVFRHLEDNLAVVECFATDGACPIASACGLRGALHHALDAFLSTLDDYTLADLAGRRRALRRALAAP